MITNKRRRKQAAELREPLLSTRRVRLRQDFLGRKRLIEVVSEETEEVVVEATEVDIENSTKMRRASPLLRMRMPMPTISLQEDSVELHAEIAEATEAETEEENSVEEIAVVSVDTVAEEYQEVVIGLGLSTNLVNTEEEVRSEQLNSLNHLAMLQLQLSLPLSLHHSE